MSRRSVMMKKRKDGDVVHGAGVDDIKPFKGLRNMSWHEFRSYATSKGVAVFGRSREEIEGDLVEVLGA